MRAIGRSQFGELDPRALLSYYPEFTGSLFETDESVDIFSGVAERMPPEASIDDISEYCPPVCYQSLPRYTPFH